MDKDRIEGGVKEGIGKAREEWGQAIDDPDTKEKGEEEQAEGNLQQRWGETKDAARDIVDGHD